MKTITLYLPPGIETAQLRKDLEEIISQYNGKKVTQIAYPLPYAVGLAQMYEFQAPTQGTIMTITNDVNMFKEERLHIPGGNLWYNAKVLLMGFNEETMFFQCLKERFEYMNMQYERD